MLAAERQTWILERIKEQGRVQVDEVAEELNVSPMTIRRDLEKLHVNNMVERCHGGAVAKKEVTYADKQTSNKSEKEKIAKVCAGFVKEGDSIFLDAGTTTYEIACLIKDIPDIMIATNDLEIAQLLKNSDVELILCGGVVQKSTGSTFGYYTTQILKDFRFDVGFFGAASINEDFDVLTPTIDKAFLKRETATHCERTYLAVDSSKFNRQAMNKINNLGDYTAVITNHAFNAGEQKRLNALGAEVILV